MGSYPLRAFPVKMFVVENHVYLLIDQHQGRRTEATSVDGYNGGMLVALDVTDPFAPVETSNPNSRLD